MLGFFNVFNIHSWIDAAAGLSVAVTSVEIVGIYRRFRLGKEAEQEAIHEMAALRAQGKALRTIVPRCRVEASRFPMRAWRAS